MNIKQSVETLKYFNKWRRGEEIEMPDPKAVGIAIDVILEFVENELNNEIRK
jgi:hypothetical protein